MRHTLQVELLKTLLRQLDEGVNVDELFAGLTDDLDSWEFGSLVLTDETS